MRGATPCPAEFIGYRYHLTIMFYYLNQLDSTIAILDKYRQSPFTRTFSDKKIRVTVIGYPILLDIRKQHLQMLTPASEEYSSSWVQERPLTMPKTSPT